MKTLQNANNSMAYTNEALTCDRCGEQYESGFLAEIKDVGLFCALCFRSAFEEYFTKYPEADHVLIRGVSSLAYRRRVKNA